jgi:hypothetical protein
MIAETWGVWAGRDCAMVRTPGYGLLFERTGAAVSAALVRIEADDESVAFDTRALALFDAATDRVVLKARDPEAGDDLVFDNDLEHELQLGRAELAVAATDEGLVLGRDGRTVERLAGDRLTLLLPSGREAPLERLERIRPAAPAPGRVAEPGRVAASLQGWALGTGCYRNEDATFRNFTIGTNRFTFGFSFGAVDDADVLHCRASRVRAYESGVLFAPLVRLFASADGLATEVTDDILAAAREDLPAAAPAGESAEPPAGDWWRLDGAEPDGLVLESRAGGRYRLARPSPDNPALIEWFRFTDYRTAGVRPQ